MPPRPAPIADACRAVTAIEQLSDLPAVTDPLPGIGGRIKSAPPDFVVEETLPYRPCGEGEHVYVTFRRAGFNTADAARMMQKRLGLTPSDVGWGGRKDKTAVVVQTVSLRCGVHRPLAEIEKALAELPFELMAIDRHLNKIKTGHVAANRFTIVVRQAVENALPRALAIARRLKATGLPNFYGPQRFGPEWRNVHRGFALFRSGRKPRRDAFMVSVVQSALFNIWLKQRICEGRFDRLMTGDVVKKTDTGGMFTIADARMESPRFDAGEIIYTGPIFGYKMRAAVDAAGRLEARLLERFRLAGEDFRRLRAPGTRRMAILRLSNLAIVETAAGLKFSFSLPSGAYATTVMREFIKAD